METRARGTGVSGGQGRGERSMRARQRTGACGGRGTGVSGRHGGGVRWCVGRRGRAGDGGASDDKGAATTICGGVSSGRGAGVRSRRRRGGRRRGAEVRSSRGGKGSDREAALVMSLKEPWRLRTHGTFKLMAAQKGLASLAAVLQRAGYYGMLNSAEFKG